MKFLLLMLFFNTGLFTSGLSKPKSKDHADVKKVIVTLFDAIKASDATTARRCFHPDAVLASIGHTKDGSPVFRKEPSADGFVSAIGMAKTELWDERIGAIQVTLDGDLAVATMSYKFYRGSTFSHCGMNAFMLMRTADGWKIINVTDTRRKDNCPS
jgi:ketosteroid isomerase-like protein